jgi:hypothetical protein
VVYEEATLKLEACVFACWSAHRMDDALGDASLSGCRLRQRSAMHPEQTLARSSMCEPGH